MDNRQQQNSFQSVGLALARAGIVLGTLLLVLRFGRYLLATPTFVSDDEGYLLLSLKHYFAGEHLYTQIYSNYGPFYFFLQRAVFGLLHLPLTFDAGRLIAYIYWVLTAVFGGSFIYRLSKNVTLASAACLATMWLARVVALEPNHPEEIVLFFLMAGCCVSVGSSPTAMVLLGAIGTSLFFIKTNVGVFFLAPALVASVCILPLGRTRNIAGKLLLAAMVGGPIILMHRFLDSWAGGFCVIGILAGAFTLIAGLRARVDSPGSIRILRYIAMGALAVAILIVLGTTVQGMSSSTLLHGLILEPLRQPAVFFIPFAVTPKMVLTIALSIGVAGLYWFPERWRTHFFWIDVLKCVAGLLVIALLVTRKVSYSVPRTFTFAPMYALLPLALLQGKAARWATSEYFPRIFVTALAAMQILQAYSVAGSQVSVGAAPFLLWAFVCVYDGTNGALAPLPSAQNWKSRINAASVLGGMVAIVVAVAMLRTGMWSQRYPYPASALAGSASLHLPPDLEMEFEALANDVRTNCQVLFTMPGMGGFNFWSGVPTPDGFNEDNWMRGVPLDQQQHTLEILKRNPSACVIHQPRMVTAWGVPDGGIDTLPLARYILHDMPTVYVKQDFEIRVSPDRTAPWIEQSPITTP